MGFVFSQIAALTALFLTRLVDERWLRKATEAKSRRTWNYVYWTLAVIGLAAGLSSALTI